MWKWKSWRRGFYVGSSDIVDKSEIDSGRTEREEKTEEQENTEIKEIHPKQEKAFYITTAYCACEKCCGKSDGITASGAKAIEGITIAADTNILPFGTKIIIDGNTYTVQDRGGAIKGNRIDIYFNSHEKALQYGRQTKEVTILKGE